MRKKESKKLFEAKYNENRNKNFAALCNAIINRAQEDVKKYPISKEGVTASKFLESNWCANLRWYSGAVLMKDKTTYKDLSKSW